MRVPAACAALPIIAGSTLSLLTWPGTGPDLPVAGAGAAALALLAAVASSADDDGAPACVWIVAGFFLTGVALGWLAADRAYDPPLLRWLEVHGGTEPVILEGRLREDAVDSAAGIALAIDVDRVGNERTSGGVRLSIGGSLAAARAIEWRRGRRVRMPALLRRPAVYLNPGVADGARALARRGICLVGTVKSASLVERLGDGSSWQEAASTARAWVRRRFAATIAPESGRSAAIASAILIGDRSRLDEDDERRLQRAGTYHVIAISGGNIATATALLLIAGRILCVPQGAAAALAIAVLLFYGSIAGPAPSVERAVTAAVLFLTARVFDHRGPPLNALAVTAVFAVASAPVAVLDAGFLLSFGATLGILLGAPLMIGPRPRASGRLWTRVWRSLRRATFAVFAATVCAELALTPVAASLFGRVTFAGLLLNFAAIPLMTVVQVAGAAVLAIPAAWGSASAAAVRLTHGAASGLVDSAHLVEVVPWLSIAVNPPAWALVAAYYGALLALIASRFRRVAAALTAATAAVMLAGPGALARDSVSPPRHPLRVVFLDVGQGDAAMIALPAGRTLLVDAGGLAAYSPPGENEESSFDIGERVVVPALRALGVSGLDALVLTHGDPDHMLGARAVLQDVRVRSIWEGVPVPPHAGLQALRTLAFEAATTWKTVQAGDREQFGEVELRVWHPPLPEWERQKIRNDDSIVLELRIGDVSIVLTGDIEKEGERAILSRADPGRLTVLKAGHHGSATSSTPEFLSALDPVAMIFSAGRDNRFGHPHPTVLQRVEGRGAAVFRTDRDGAVIVETDGRTIEISGWTGRTFTVAARVGRNDRR